MQLRSLLCLLLITLISPTLFGQDSSCALSTAPPPTNSVRLTCNEYSGSDDFFMPDENSEPLVLKVNFIYITDTSPDAPKNFDRNNAAHLDFLNTVVRRTEFRISRFNASCPTGQIRQCSSWQRGCCHKKDADAPSCLCEECVDLGQNWIGDSKIRFDISQHWVADSILWNSDPDGDTDGLNCAPQGKASDLWTQTCPTTPEWYLHDFDLNITANCNVQPRVEKGINLYFTVDGDAYEQLVVQQQTGVSWCGLACATWPSESDLSLYAREHMPNVFLQYYQFRDNPDALDNIAWETARTIVHEIGHNLSLRHNDACSCYLMKTQFCGTKNMITAAELKSMHRTIALSNVRELVKCRTLSPYDENDPGQDALHVDSSQTWDFDMKVFRHIVIEPGATLTISCRLVMVPGGQIIVKDGGELIVDGGVITDERPPVNNACDDNPSEDCDGGLPGGVQIRHLSANNEERLTQELSSEMITIFPNPAHSTISILTPAELVIQRMELRDAFGKVVWLRQTDFSTTLQLHLPTKAGVYYLTVVSQDRSFAKRVVRL
ncbi:MAG: zinc-dependent metalloprotease [Bacteroidota bacterium]